MGQKTISLSNQKNPLPTNDWDIEENDNEEIKLLHFKWVSIDELKELDLKPTAIKKLLVDKKVMNLII